MLRWRGRAVWIVMAVMIGLAGSASSVWAKPDKGSEVPESQGRTIGEHPEQVLVKFQSKTADKDKKAIYDRHGLKELGEIQGIGVKKIKIRETDTPHEVVQKLKFHHGRAIEFAEVDAIMEPSLVPNDPLFAGSQTDKQQIGAPTAWDVTTGSPAVIIGVADTGVDCAHADLAANCVPGWNFYDNNSTTADVYGHGTPVAGVAGAIGNNGIGVAGTVWSSKIMPLRVSSPTGSASWSTVATAITYAADHGAKVVNNSYQSGGSSTVRSAANYLKKKGGLLTVSEGNYGANTGYDNSPDLLSVSAVDGNDVLYGWSSFGNDVDIAAPGCTGASTANGGSYRSFCGTSNSAPEVAGALALIWSVNPLFTPDQVQSFLFNSAKDLGTAGWDMYFGWGRIDVARAVALARATMTDTVPPSQPTGLLASAPSPTRVDLTWTPSTDDIAIVGYRMFRNGAQIGLATAPLYSDTTVQPLTTYSYAVQAYDGGGNLSPMSASASVTTPEPVIAITSFATTNKTSTTATITWTTNVPSTGSVAYGLNSGALTSTASDGTPGTTHTVVLSNLQSKTTYYYQITATELDGSPTATSGISSFKTNPGSAGGKRK